MDYLAFQLARADRGIMFDTNVLLVYLVGLFDSRVVREFKKTASYSPEDIQLLLNLVHLSRGVTVTPHILAEVCNHIDTAKPHHKESLFQVLHAFIENSAERRQEALRLAKYDSFNRIGISDVSLVDASLRSHLVVTDDGGCYAAINEVGGLAINLNHLRSAEWLS